MATVKIETIEYSKNPVSVQEAFLIKVYVTRTYEITVTPGNDKKCGQYVCGQQLSITETLKP